MTRSDVRSGELAEQNDYVFEPILEFIVRNTH
jgi:hypothetical protein